MISCRKRSLGSNNKTCMKKMECAIRYDSIMLPNGKKQNIFPQIENGKVGRIVVSKERMALGWKWPFWSHTWKNAKTSIGTACKILFVLRSMSRMFQIIPELRQKRGTSLKNYATVYTIIDCINCKSERFIAHILQPFSGLLDICSPFTQMARKINGKDSQMFATNVQTFQL